ncbi:unnamed protein product [Hermetia illucens]|uniref:Major facilitator superfamily (MFS) profile domain-containing protein n=1 Tax=Hermetia illucens TaxID=343691 RepID=A0A7R8Z1U5_HERIL|nr:proton-coupled folate transporter-like [Hermetia illucens]CAD7092313.1 unnamed protein product [Hermetia illucens]
MEASNELLVSFPEAGVQAPLSHRLKKLCQMSLGPAIFLLFFAISFSSVVGQNWIIKLTCTTIFGYNETICNQLGTANATEEIHEIERTVQPYVTQILMTVSLAGGIGPSLTGIFFGAWSDKFGRRPLLLTAFGGFFVSSVMSTFISYLSTVCLVSPWVVVLTTIPTSLVGGFCSILGGTFCYIADTATEKQRPFQLAIVGAFISLGMFLGSLTSAYAIDVLSMTAIFGIHSALMFTALLYITLFVAESLDSERLQTTSKLRGLFKWSLVKDMSNTLLQRRPGYDRMIVWICIAVLCVCIFAVEGPSTIFFLYVREQFHWTASDYATYNAISTLVGALGSTLAIIILQKCLKFSPVSIILIGLGTNLLNHVVKTFATESWHLYLAITISAASGAAFPTCRSLIATVVPSEEIGKVYSVSTALEFIAPIGSAPLYTYVYNATLDTFAGAFNGITVFLYLISYILFAILFGLETYDPSIINRPAMH